MAVPYTFGTATAAIPLSQLDSNFATAITLGNTAVYLGNTTTSIGNLTLTNVTISSGEVTTGNVSVSGNVTLSGGTANGVAYLNGSKVLTTGSALVFDGTNLRVGTTSSLSVADKLTVVGGNFAVQRTSGITTFMGDNTVDGYAGTATNQAFALLTNSVERARIDTSGNLGLGVTPSAWGGTYKAIQLGSYGALETNNSNKYMAVASNHYNNGSGDLYIANGYATRYYQVDGTHVWNTAASGTAGNAISFTQAMTLDASGNFLVGTTSAVFPSGQSGMMLSRSSQPVLRIAEGSSYFDLLTTGDNVYINNRANGFMAFYTNATERARINSSGQLLWGTTSTFGNYLANFYSADLTYTNNGIAVKNNTNNTGGYFFACINYLGNVIGSINQNASTTVQYSTSSDYRLKEDIQPMTGALEKVALLKPVIYKWKTDGSAGQGFIAHELAEVVPDAVSGEKDAVETYTDEEGNEQTRPRYQGIDTSFLVATLTAAIQEMKAIIDTQASTITQLQADVAALKGA